MDPIHFPRLFSLFSRGWVFDKPQKFLKREEVLDTKSFRFSQMTELQTLLHPPLLPSLYIRMCVCMNTFIFFSSPPQMNATQTLLLLCFSVFTVVEGNAMRTQRRGGYRFVTNLGGEQLRYSTDLLYLLACSV